MTIPTTSTRPMSSSGRTWDKHEWGHETGYRTHLGFHGAHLRFLRPYNRLSTVITDHYRVRTTLCRPLPT
eukprot:244412-Hanusia_phi.AAC.1